MDLEIISDVIYHPSLALRAQLLRRCLRRAFCFAMLSGRAHRRDNVQVMGNADWGARLRTRKDTTAALKALRCSALVWQNCVLFHYWLHDKLLGRCPKPYQRRCLWTPQGGSPLDPSARLSWSHSLNSSACLSSFFLTPPLSPHTNHHTAASSASNSSSSPPESSHSARSHS